MILPEARREIFNRDKVAILTNYPFDGRTFTGGVETATAGLLEGLAAFSEQFDFHVIALSRDVRAHSVERRDGITFHFLAIPPVRPHVIPNIINARTTVRRLNADLVHCQDNMALAVGAVLARPARKLFTIHGIKGMEAMLWEGPEYWSHSMDAILERWVRKQFDEVITISPYVDRFLPIEVKKYHVPNPVRRIFFENPRTDSGDKHVLFVGAFTRLKRPMDLLEAFAAVKEQHVDATLTLAGPEEDRQYVKEMKRVTAERKIRDVRFVGPQSPEQIARLMRAATVLVLPSAQENSPMVVAEAMASGLPVIASRVGGVPHMITDGVDGLLFECGNVMELSRHLLRMLESSHLRHDLACKARQKALSMFSSDAVAAATVEVYRTLLGKNR
jgi:glycosyltransferase involved in cell wall biosynthesis